MYRLIFALAISLIVVGQVLAAQSSKTVVSDVVRAAGTVAKAEKTLQSLLEQPTTDPKQAEALVQTARGTVKTIKELLDQLDANYEALNEDQRSAVRESWTISELLSAYVDNQQDDLAGLTDKERREDARENATCAVRRAEMLVSSVRRLAK
ncbi:hypothetical protein [uncultured Paludibaculum sp.]|uniref:hypothetical protein n=1 Tax=uncultured Paludibaculum sp. TaxID=1765020 RepID=UPI002AAABC17|nr:hypothetical protein [uncultured Paludibaculum sp.]